MLQQLLRNIYEKEEEMPNEWRESISVPIYKQKGDVQVRNNYRGIKLMSHTMKIWERIIEKRLREEVMVGEEQFEYMLGGSTVDMIFTLNRWLRSVEKDRRIYIWCLLIWKKPMMECCDKSCGTV